jgi:hypothetical protein
MPGTIKVSQFPTATNARPGDIVTGLRNGVNTNFNLSSGASGAGVSVQVEQDGHGFLVNQAVRVDSTDYYVLAQADNAFNAEAVGLVVDVIDPNNFMLQQVGPVTGLSGLNAGDVYFLSETTPGDLTTTEPSLDGEVSKPMLIAVNDTTGYILSMRGQVIAGAPPTQTEQIENILVREINQPGHGLSVQNWVRMNGANYVAGLATTQQGSEIVGLVTNVDGDDFTVQSAGFIGGAFAGLTPGATYYLSPTVAGGMTATEPSTTGQWTKPVFIATSATDGYILEQRGWVVDGGGGGGGNAERLTQTIFQTNHGLLATDWVRIDNTTGDYVKAKADSFVHSLTVGMVIEKLDDDTFVLQTSGYLPFGVVSALATGELYYLSPTVEGGMTNVAPTTDGQVSRPVFMPGSATTGYILEERSLLLPFGGEIAGNVVQTIRNTNISLTTGVLPFSVVITPSNSTSRVRINASITTSHSGGCILCLRRNGSNITVGGTTPIGISFSNGATGGTESFTYIDSPATTLAITYDFIVFSPSSAFAYDNSFPAITLIAEEIGA